jgi:hypothetical protein
MADQDKATVEGAAGEQPVHLTSAEGKTVQGAQNAPRVEALQEVGRG